jgi:thiamine-monophosphate kinase
MMDLSDGIGADLPRLARASGCGFALDEACVPITRGSTLAQALGDGEDFELLFALAPRDATGIATKWRRAFPRVPLSQIGRLTRRSTFNSQLPTRGYDHFADT